MKMTRKVYHTIATSTEHDDDLLDEVRKIFVEAIEMSHPEIQREYVVEEANCMWKKHYRRRAKIRLGLHRI